MPESPLNQEHCQCINDTMQAVAYTKDLVKRCSDCGFDMARENAELEAQEAVLNGLKRNFFPQAV